jgi:uncharacterized protein (DUF1015 family)
MRAIVSCRARAAVATSIRSAVVTAVSPVQLALHPFRALRPRVDADRLGALLCPPYDVISAEQRTELLARDPDNAVAIVLPEATAGADAYTHARDLIDRGVTSGLLGVDDSPALYVYEMREAGGSATRGLLGAVDLDPSATVILPHENTMAGPVADRLALMTATEANVEPIYLVYDGGGPASALVAGADDLPTAATARTPDGIMHTLWAITDTAAHDAVAADLAPRKALIAHGHHSYATYLAMQRQFGAERGSGPWDRGLTLLVDSSTYGPQVHPIHRVLVGLGLDAALAPLAGRAEVIDALGPDAAAAALERLPGFAIALSDGTRSVVVHDSSGKLADSAVTADEPASLAQLDVTVLHRTLVRDVWQLTDDVEVVGFAHSVADAVEDARRTGGTAVLMRATPVAAVAAVAAQGARMPRKSTLFTPKPASGLVMRRFADES